MAELTFILEASREAEYSRQKFAAAMKGVDLDKETGRDKRPRKGKKATTFEDIQARVASGGLANDANDILAMIRARQNND